MALVKSVNARTPSCTSARRPFSHCTGTVTVAPAASYQAQAASRSSSRTFTARLAKPVTATAVAPCRRTDPGSSPGPKSVQSQAQQPGRVGAQKIGPGPVIEPGDGAL